jgi:hypothetical protein
MKKKLPESGISPKFRETEPSGSDSAGLATGTETGICNLDANHD